MDSYVGPNDDPYEEDEMNDFSINNEDISNSIDRLSRSFENFKRTVSFQTIHEYIKQFEEINKKIDR
jgi:archaellum component FlaC